VTEQKESAPVGLIEVLVERTRALAEEADRWLLAVGNEVEETVRWYVKDANVLPAMADFAKRVAAATRETVDELSDELMPEAWKGKRSSVGAAGAPSPKARQHAGRRRSDVPVTKGSPSAKRSTRGDKGAAEGPSGGADKGAGAAKTTAGKRTGGDDAGASERAPDEPDEGR
jgi:hypothetical protein